MLHSGLSTSNPSLFELKIVYDFCHVVINLHVPHDKKDPDKTIHNLQLASA